MGGSRLEGSALLMSKDWYVSNLQGGIRQGVPNRVAGENTVTSKCGQRSRFALLNGGDRELN